jgi:hypothetical protein
MIPIGFFSAAVATLGAYWMGLFEAKLSGTAKNLFFRNVEFDSSGNLIISGDSEINDLGDTHVVKVNSSGAGLAWQRIITNTGTQYSNDSATTSDGSLYSFGETTVNSSSVLFKYNSSGVLQWQRALRAASGNISGDSIAADTLSSSVYVSARFDALTLIAKYDASGNITWQKSLSTTLRYTSIAVDSAGNVLVAGQSGSSPTFATLIKLNSSGVIQWQKSFGDSTVNFGSASFVVTDSADNVIVFTNKAASTTAGVIVKFNSSGVSQWQREFPVAQSFAVAVDNSDSIYVTGYAATAVGEILKIASGGTLTFQRRIAGTSATAITDIRADASGNMYLSGYSFFNSIYKGFAAKLPADGSLTGTYAIGSDSVTYSTPSLSFTSVAYTVSTPTFTVSDITTNTASTITYTDSLSDLTFTKTA